ncbi:MAG: hypothetical protein SFZ02_00340 [bacterium]|nr:hypothetical protein [bacterium]
MDVYQFTSLQRPVNPFVYLTHRLLVLCVPLAGVILGVYTLLTGGDFGSAVMAGFHAGASAMLAWVLAREIDPDNPYSAFVAIALATLGAFIATPNIWALAGGVVLLRIVNHIVGYSAKLLDGGVAIGVGMATMLVTGAWIFGIIVAVAFLIDALLPDPSPFSWTFLLGSLIITIPVWRYLDVMLIGYPQNWLIVMLVIGALFALHIITLQKFTSVYDVTQAPVMPMRIKAGMALMLMMAVVFGVLYGDSGVLMLMPLWAVFVGVMVYRVGLIFNRREVR